MKILISGSSGFVGNALVKHLEGDGHEVHRLLRRKEPEPDRITWDPLTGRIDPEQLEGFDAVVHLGGENIASGRWTKRRKKRLRDSRVNTTRFLALTLSQLRNKPEVFACASAIGIYGSRGDAELTEASPPGVGFFPDIGQEWERACEPAAFAGIRVVNWRLGVILGRQDGALAKMLTPFRLCVGGVIGNGRQFWSWISLEDTLRAMTFTLSSPVAGPVNLVSPQPVTNHQFTKTLGRVLRRPTIIPLPAFAARTILGEMADAALLASARVKPKVLQDAGFRFNHDDLESALRAEL
ncbi:MAG: TIGR01777 family oxidoreductase [Limisphaerales bacterium]